MATIHTKRLFWPGALVLAMNAVMSPTACGHADSAATLRALADTLIRQGAEDQAGRERMATAVTENDTLFLRRMVREDSARSLWLRDVIRKHGWPGRALVGDTAAQAAWLILQHTPLEGFQAEMLPVLDSAADRGDVARSDLAMLEDRIRVHAGKPQRYGASFHVANGTLVADSIEDIAHVDERRRRVGLPPMDEYAKLLGELYKMPVIWPPK